MPFKKGQSGNPSGRRKVVGEIRELAMQEAPDAFQRIAKLVRSDDERVALAAAQTILDRAYGKAIQTVNTNVTRRAVNLTDAELEAIALSGSLTVSGETGRPVESDSVH